MARLPLKSLFCEKFGCPPGDYEERAFRKCLYWHARVLAPVIRVVKPDFFQEDLKLIGYLGEAEGVRDATADLVEYSYLNRAHGRFMHANLNLRVSGKKASQMVNQLFQQASRVKTDSAAPTS